MEASIQVHNYVCHPGPQTMVSSHHRSELHYIDAFLHEVLRMKPNAPIGLPRETLCDTSVGKYWNSSKKENCRNYNNEH